jgi:hypothetical protein
MNNFYVYVHYRNDTLQPFYVGKGNGKRYMSKHSRNKHWKNIVNKVGFTPMIIENFLTEEKSFELEKYYIQHFGRNNLCNMTDGGDGMSGHIPTEQTRKKISQGRMGKTHNEKTKKKMSEIKWNMTKETKKKISESKKGKIYSIEHKKKISESRIGKPSPFKGGKHSEETKKKMSEIRKGKLPWNKGKSGYLIYGKNPMAKKVINIETGEIYESAKEVAEILNKNYSTFKAQLNGRNPNKTPFKYYE